MPPMLYQDSTGPILRRLRTAHPAQRLPGYAIFPRTLGVHHTMGAAAVSCPRASPTLPKCRTTSQRVLAVESEWKILTAWA